MRMLVVLRTLVLKDLSVVQNVLDSVCELDCVKEGNNRQKLTEKIAEDDSLRHCRKLANFKQRGYKLE